MTETIASRKRRGIALFIDSLVFGMLSSIVLHSLILENYLLWHDQPLVIVLGGLFTSALFAAKDSFRGQGIGKRLLGIRVVNQDGKPASAFQCFIRNISLMIWPIEGLFMTLNSNKKRMGDYFAQTQVIRDVCVPMSHRFIIACFILVIYQGTPDLPSGEFTPADFTDLTQLMVKQSDAYVEAVKIVESQPNIQQLVGDIQDIQLIGNSQINIHNGKGKAHLNLLVIGSLDQLPVNMTLQREQGQWQLESMHFEKTQPFSN